MTKIGKLYTVCYREEGVSDEHSWRVSGYNSNNRMRKSGLGKQPVRVAVLTNAVLAYRRPVFEILLKDEAFQLKVFVSMPLSTSDELACKILPLHYSKGININKKTYHSETNVEQNEYVHIPLRLPFDLFFYRPDIIISGEFGLRSLVAFFVARLIRVPFVLWSEAIFESSKGISQIQKILRRFLIPRATSFLAWGSPAVDYLKTYLISDDAIIYCAQAVDNEYWMKQAKTYSKTEIRTQLGTKGKVFLAVGRLVALKGFDYLLNAWGALPDEIIQQNTLIIVGAGEEENDLRRIASDIKNSNIVFTGFKPSTELPKYYAAADVFVFPSLVDVWGLVVNEAMACGLPVLASKYTGAAQELIDSPEVGEIFDPLDIGSFTSLLLRWCAIDKQTSALATQKAVSRLNFEVTVQSIKKLIHDKAVN